ncbi:hypothetical protein IHV82_03940 [Mycobacterium avium]|nr:hypothetical protein IHV82_03940 [Mycobacterium avium]
MLVTDKPHDLPSTNALDDIPDDLLDVPAAYLAFGSTPCAMDEPPELGDIKTYIVRAKCVGQSCSERQDGELRYGRRLSIIGCWEAGKQPPSTDEDQPGLFDEAGDPNPGAFYRAVAADDQLFGTGTDVYLRQPEQVDQLIRSAAQS